MPAPPLWASSLELADAVNAMANQYELTLDERKSALEILSGVIAGGETSHVKALRTVYEAIEHGRPRIAEVAAQYATAGRASRSGGIGRVPEQGELRWDMNE